MKKLLILILIILVTPLYATSEETDWSQYDIQTTTLQCDIYAIRLNGYGSTIELDLEGKSCTQAVSYIKDIAAYPLEYTRVSAWPAANNTIILLEYLTKK